MRLKIVYETNEDTQFTTAWFQGSKYLCKTGASKAEAIGRLILSEQPNQVTLIDFNDSRELKVNDEVMIKRYKDNPDNKYGRITTIKDGRYHVSNMNMPYCGSVCNWFDRDELE